MRRPWIGRKDFLNSHGTRRTNRRRGFQKLREEEFLELLFM
jgi:hypothetical protein